MSDYVLIDGDTVTFLPAFGAAVVTVQPGKLAGSGKGTVNGKKLCVSGDEGNVKVQQCPYLTPTYPTPGMGTLTIKQLAGNQKAQKTQTGGKAVLLSGQGAMFTANFHVDTPAQPPPTAAAPADQTEDYPGQGSFTTTNTIFQGV